MLVKLDEGAIMPTRAHATDAGLDLYSREELMIFEQGNIMGSVQRFDTGVHVQIPPGMYGKLESKSGLMCTYDIVCSGGVIDQGYTGSIVVRLENHGTKPYLIRKGQKIAQLILMACAKPPLELVTELPETARGDNGFGSTGL